MFKENHRKISLKFLVNVIIGLTLFSLVGISAYCENEGTITETDFSGHIYGKVLESGSGAPIRNFTVRLAMPKEQKPEDIKDSQTGLSYDLMHNGITIRNGNGTFSILYLTTNSVLRVIVEAPDFIPAYIDRVTVKPSSDKSFNAVFILKHGVTIEGIVVDSIKQKPISEATVTLLDSLGGYYRWFSWQNSYEANYSVKKAETDKEGKFSFSGINPTKLDVLVTHPDYSSTRLLEVDLSQEKNQKELKLSIDPAGKIEGTVYDKTEKPLSNIQMELYLKRDLEELEEHYGQVSTDEKGHYQFDNLPSGKWRLTRLEGLRFDRLKEIDLKPGEMKKVDFGSEKGVKLYGTVKHKGTPLDEVSVSVIDESMKFVIAGTITDKNGNYEIIGLESKEYQINAQKGKWTDPNKLYLKKKIELEGEKVKLDFTFPYASLSGVVKDFGTGKTLSNILIRAYKKAAWSEIFSKDDIGAPEKGWLWRPLQKVTTLADGSFRLENLASGEYIILAGKYDSDNRVATGLITIEENTEMKDILIQINQSGKVNIKVISSETKQPIKESSIALYTETDYMLNNYYNKFIMNGGITIENLKPGKYYIMAGGSDYLFSDKKEIEVSNNKASNITIELKAAGKVSFKLIEPLIPISGILYMTLRLKRTDGKFALKTLFHGNQNGIIGFFEGELNKRSFSIDTLEKGEYKADIEIYREDRKGIITYNFQKPLYAASETFTIESKKETIVTIDMNKPINRTN